MKAYHSDLHDIIVLCQMEGENVKLFWSFVSKSLNRYSVLFLFIRYFISYESKARRICGFNHFWQTKPVSWMSWDSFRTKCRVWLFQRNEEKPKIATKSDIIWANLFWGVSSEGTSPGSSSLRSERTSERVLQQSQLHFLGVIFRFGSIKLITIVIGIYNRITSLKYQL